MRAQTPNGQRFRVRRRWLPWRRRVRMPDGTGDMMPAGDDPISSIFATVLLIPFLILVVLISLEFLLLLLLLPFYVVGRIIFSRHWDVEISSKAKWWHRWRLVNTEEILGFRAASDRIRAIASQIRGDQARARMTAGANRGA